MPQWKIDHDRPGCIGCGAYAAVNPDFWIMSPTDGKSDLVGSVFTKEGEEVVREQLEMEELNGNKEAAESCPVNVIHIIDLKTGQNII